MTPASDFADTALPDSHGFIGSHGRRRALTGALAFAVGAAWELTARAGAPPAVAAAADLKFALGEIAPRFEADTGHAVRLTFGSSGNFAQQIARGAPFELFLSADEDYVFRLAAAGHA